MAIECKFNGFCAADAEVRTSQAGKQWVRLRVGVGKDDAVQWLSVAVFGTLAAAGQIGFVSHSRAPHLVVRGTLYTADGRRAGSLDLELERAVVAFGRQVRLMKWRHPDGMFSARWFVDLGKCENWYGLAADQALHITCKIVWWLLLVAGTLSWIPPAG